MRRLILVLILLLTAPVMAHAGVVVVPIVVPQAVMMPPASIGHYESVHTVAVVSAIGETVTLQNNHFMGIKSKRLDISAWRLDDMVGSLLRQYLSPRFAFKDIAYDRMALAAIPNGSLNNEWLNPANKAFLHSLPADDLDAFIVVRPDQEYQTPGLPGLALENGNGLSDTLPEEWANYEIEIVDAHSLTVIAKAYSRVQFREGGPVSFVGKLAGKDLALSDDLTPTSAQNAMLHRDFSRLLTVSLIETLRALNLGATLPEPGARSTVPITANNNPYSAVKTVALIASIGDMLELRHVGSTVFSHSADELPVPEWKVDAHAEDVARANLSSRFTIRDVAIDRANFAKIFDEESTARPSALPLVPGVDAYIAILKFPVLLAASGLTPSIFGHGIGIFNRAPLIGEKTAVYASFLIVVVDAKTGKVIHGSIGVMSPVSPHASTIRDVTNTTWPDNPTALTVEQAGKIRDQVYSILDDSVPETMLRLGLTDKMVSEAPPPSAVTSLGNTATSPTP